MIPLKTIFETKQFKQYRTIKLTDTDKVYFLHKLTTGKRVYSVIPFLKVVEQLPLDLLGHILREAIEYTDISAPKKWMDSVSRIFTPETVQQYVLDMILATEEMRIKCRAVSILYCIGGPNLSYKKQGQGEWLPVGETVETWNGGRYERTLIEGNIEAIKDRREKYILKRMNILLTEFLKYDNLVYRYYINRYLLEKESDYPADLQPFAQKIHPIVSDINFPKGLNQTRKLRLSIQGNKSMEELLYTELNWRRLE
ncbi:MAG: hypothetical protein P1U56_19780 [Saprospiraceae bacterium]|nr:hypothetical protein [Saprospiraceae bacterium]